MSPKRWFLLLIFYISYLMFGASIYYHIEHGLEKQQRAVQLKEQTEVNDFLMILLDSYNETVQNEALDRLGEYCERPVTAPTDAEFQIPYKWTFYHSFFFVFTVCSTVGYGNLAPTSPLGQMIMIVYSVIGIPVNGILYAGLGEYFGKLFVSIYRRYKKYKMMHNSRFVPLQLGLITTVFIALIPGITFFLLLPAWIFTFFEGWPFVTALYYAYVTTTTIGFGDYVATFGETQPAEFGGWFIVYEIYVILWMIFSLGYLVMIMTYITRGLQSKRLTRLEQQLSTNIKATQNRIWSGVTKDVGYLRRILNELYIMKIKPEYSEPDVCFFEKRSSSCPDLSMYRIEAWPNTLLTRKRALSEGYVKDEQRVRAASETAIDQLEKQRSYDMASTYRSTTELLARVVSALASVRVPTKEDEAAYDAGTADMYGGYHGFSDSQILASEWSFTSLNGPPPKPRGRAFSDYNIIRRSIIRSNDWTWSGDNEQIQEAINRRSQRPINQKLYHDHHNVAGSAFRSHDYVVHMEEDDVLKKPIPTKKYSVPDGLRRLFKRRSSQDVLSTDTEREINKMPTTTTNNINNDRRKISVMSVPELQQPPLDIYNTVTTNASPTYYQQQQQQQNRLHPIGNAINMRGPPRRGSMFDMQIGQRQIPDSSGMPTLTSTSGISYQRNAVAMNKKHRESMFGAKPTWAMPSAAGGGPPATGGGRRGSAAAFTQRRGSLFTDQQQQQQSTQMGRRGSMFHAVPPRRPSIFSVTSEEDMEVLENTTVADLIRALEVVHTQSVLGEAAAASIEPTTSKSYVGFVDCFSDNKRKKKNSEAGLNPPTLPPILSLFGGNSNETLNAVAANRLYGRRATVVGSSLWSPNALTPSHVQPIGGSGGTSNVLTRRRKSAIHIQDPPPSYNEHEHQSQQQQQIPQKQPTRSAPSAMSKFKRRFSIRPTALYIPPGKAPAPQNPYSIAAISTTSSGSTIVSTLTTPTVTVTAATPPPSSSSSVNLSQTTLQRRLSLRPSPLARELTVPGALEASGNTSATTPLVPSTRIGPSSSGITGMSSSSTHSPLSRIVQIAQAQRKSSMPEATGKKPDTKF